MNGCPICGSESGWCEFCPKKPANDAELETARSEMERFREQARERVADAEQLIRDFLAEPEQLEQEPDGLELLRAEMRRIETWARKPERRIASHCFDGRFVALTFADGSTTIIGD